MAKVPKKTPKKTPKKVGGPFLAAAVFCDNVLEEKPADESKGGVVSAIRIFDTITATLPAVIPEGVTPGFQVKALITFRAGDATGKHRLTIIKNGPDGKQDRHPVEAEIDFKGTGHKGVNVTITLGLPARNPGLYWFDVVLDGKVVTRMPLMLVIQPASAAPPSQPAK